MTKLDNILKSKRHYFADQGPYSQAYGLPNGHIWLSELDRNDGRAPKIDAIELWCWRRLLKVPGQQGDQTSQS